MGVKDFAKGPMTLQRKRGRKDQVQIKAVAKK